MSHDITPRTTHHTHDPDRVALILGLTGGYGGQMAAELGRRGWTLRAMVRDVDRGREAARALGLEVELVRGDALVVGEVTEAARGASVIVHGLNPPYELWESQSVAMTRAVADAAAVIRATILFPGNVYAYEADVAITEDTSPAPPTRKGELRVEVERVLRDATGRGARVIVLRGGDFFGLDHASSWMSHILGKTRKGGAIMMPMPPGVRHAMAYLPDFAATHVALLDRSDELDDWSTFHFAGHVTHREELIEAIRGALGDPNRKVSNFPWPLLRLLGLFHAPTRELVAMRYLWTQEVLMNQDLLTRTLGRVPHTPLQDALAAELDTGAEVELQRPRVA